MNRMMATMILALASAAPAMADDKDDLKAAAKKLADAPNYAWTTTVKNNAENAQGGPARGMGPVEGKSEKDGVTWVQMKLGEMSTEAAFKGEKFAMKLKDQWIGSGDAPGGGGPGGGGMMMGRMLKNIKPGAAGFADMIDKLENVKQDGGVYTANFTPEGAKDQLAPKVDGQQAVPNMTVTDAKGSLKVWVKDGMITKVESTLKGKMTFGQREREIDRTATTEFKDVGTTKIELPDEAKKKLE